MRNLKEALTLHKKSRGKIRVISSVPLRNSNDLSLAYTPGAAAASKAILRNPKKAEEYTTRGNSVAIVTNGTSVLGMGNIGPLASLPVMEGKAVLFRKLAGIDAFPLCIDAKNPKEVINFCRRIAPTFGGINLEDIAAPDCFEIEDALQEIGIPVVHDDQHGTAIVVLAALINACKVTGKNISEISVVISGAGAAGTAIAKMLAGETVHKPAASVKDILVCDREGIIYRGRKRHMNKYKENIARISNKNNLKGTLIEAMKEADAFIGVSTGNIVTEKMVRSMAKEPIVLALSNPVPEIAPEKARNAGAAIVGTGRSDYPNQINNVLAFPGLFRGVLGSRAKKFRPEMFHAAAHAVAGCIRKPSKNRLLPSALDKKVAYEVSKAVAKNK